MSIYSYKCELGHVTEQVHPMSKYPREVKCEECCGCNVCAKPAHIVILHAPMIAVEYLERQGYDIGSGQYFSAKHQQKEWMRQAGVEQMGPEDSSRISSARKDFLESQYDKAK